MRKLKPNQEMHIAIGVLILGAAVLAIGLGIASNRLHAAQEKLKHPAVIDMHVATAGHIVVTATANEQFRMCGAMRDGSYEQHAPDGGVLFVAFKADPPRMVEVRPDMPPLTLRGIDK